ncbi:MAG: hypothetical protein VKJ06_08725 [Vampirovibrionales bacterium]|nr:hypothetical protein [Vampirovibrionales bacterium]
MAIKSPTDLPQTLAGRVQTLREARGYTRARLAQIASMPLELIDAIEGGLELFLAEVNRRRLARALRVPTLWLRQVERDPLALQEVTGLRGQTSAPSLNALDADALSQCPDCGADIHVRTFNRQDVDGKAFELIRARCTKCLFERTAEMPL